MGVEGAGPPSGLLRDPDEPESPVLRLMLRRASEGSLPGRRDDEQLLCLAIEGGGMRGAVSAGMCLVLEAAGLTGAFDRIYGVSAGALNGWGVAAGQAALSASNYRDAVVRHVIRPTGPLRGRPLVDLDLLFDELIAGRRPLSAGPALAAPELRALATSLETMSLRVLRDFADLDELICAVRASAFLPRFAGEPPVFRGEQMADGSLIEPIPFRTAVAEGATHVLVLRSRPAGYRRGAFSELGPALAVRDDQRLVDLLRSRHHVYNRQVEELERGRSVHGGHLHQIAVADDARLLAPLQANEERVVETIAHGAQAMGQAVLTRPVGLTWQPVVCLATDGPLSPTARVPESHARRDGPS